MKPRDMKKPKLSLEPQDVNADVWYYEEPRGILLVHRVHTTSHKYLQTEQVLIPWRMLKKSLSRKYPNT